MGGALLDILLQGAENVPFERRECPRWLPNQRLSAEGAGAAEIQQLTSSPGSCLATYGKILVIDQKGFYISSRCGSFAVGLRDTSSMPSFQQQWPSVKALQVLSVLAATASD